MEITNLEIIISSNKLTLIEEFLEYLSNTFQVNLLVDFNSYSSFNNPISFTMVFLSC